MSIDCFVKYSALNYKSIFSSFKFKSTSAQAQSGPFGGFKFCWAAYVVRVVCEACFFLNWADRQGRCLLLAKPVVFSRDWIYSIFLLFFGRLVLLCLAVKPSYAGRRGKLLCSRPNYSAIVKLIWAGSGKKMCFNGPAGP